MPAAFCGVYGIKPSHGRVPYWPTPANGLISHVGPLTRTVTDAALMLQAMAGPDDRDMTSLESEPEDFAGRLDEGIGQLRIGYSPDLGYLKVDAEVSTLVGTAVAARQRRRRRWNAYDTDEIRTRLHERFDLANDGLSQTRA